MAEDRTSFNAAVLLGVTYAFSVMDRKIVAVLMEPIKADMQLTDTQLALMSGLVFAFFYGVMGIPIARLADRANRVSILSVCLGLWSLMTMLSGMAMNFVTLLLARMGVGVGEAGCMPCGQSLIADYYEESRRGRALAIFAVGVPVGSTVASVAGGVLADQIGWRMTLVAAGVPGLLFAIGIKFWLREPARTVEPVAERLPLLREMRSLMAIKGYRYALLGHLGMVSVAYTLMIWGPALMMRSFDVSLTQVGLLTGGILAISGAAGSLLSGFLADRFVQDSPAWLGRIPLISSLLAVPAMLVYIFGMSLPVFLVGLTLVSTLLNAHTPPTYATYHRTVPSSSRAMAVAVSALLVNFVGLGLSPLLIGMVSDLLAPQYGEASLRYAILVVLAYLPLAAWCYWKVMRLLQEPQGEGQLA